MWNRSQIDWHRVIDDLKPPLVTVLHREVAKPFQTSIFRNKNKKNDKKCSDVVLIKVEIESTRSRYVSNKRFSSERRSVVV